MSLLVVSLTNVLQVGSACCLLICNQERERERDRVYISTFLHVTLYRALVVLLLLLEVVQVDAVRPTGWLGGEERRRYELSC